MGKEDISRLASACREADEDLFFVAGVLSDYETLAALFVMPDEPTLLVLPGTFAVPARLLKEDMTARFSREGFPTLRACFLSDGVLAADARLLAEGDFRAFCEARHVSHLFVPFAELADEKEYGGRSVYRWIGEWRASLPYQLRVTALFSVPFTDYGPFVARFASRGCTVIDASCAPSVCAYRTVNIKKKYDYTFELAQRRVTRRTAVFFTDRREAEEFRRFLRKNGVNGLSFNGAVPAAEQAEILEAFLRGEGPLFATKSLLASCLFYRADEAFFCGAPYSFSFLTRCASFAKDGELTCCFCPEDFDTDVRILKCFAENRPEEEREPFLTDSMYQLLGVKQMLAEPE